MRLTGTPLLVLASVAAVMGPVALVLWLRRRPVHGVEGRNGWGRTVGRFGLVVGCQLLAAIVLFLWVNVQYGFYTSWSDLLGRTNTNEASIDGNALVPKGDGRAQVVTVNGGPHGGGRHQVLVWLPHQYDERADAHTRFPVVMVLPGQPSTVDAMYTHYQFGTVATSEIDSGRVKPFIAVFPPLMTDPPRDTECTNVSGGPQAETWLDRTVPTAIDGDFRVTPRPWSMIGWSTGGFCSAKLLLHDPSHFTAAASLGGYFSPILDHTTGDLFHGRRTAEQQNSPLWLYRHGGLHDRRLLVVTGRQDNESYAPSETFIDASRGDPAVANLIFPTGGHNYHNYQVLLSGVLQWLQRVRALTG
ncbi:alpha/beta hydrolase [uncultured Friedmanniella sp.]|uniref:alpha/beta hydrolase n=1 Tax=uncultured Friedmanniella sp. TaxID=335381 RepID=UPI0035CBE303